MKAMSCFIAYDGEWLAKKGIGTPPRLCSKTGVAEI